jgi:hypothetical protein
LADQENLALAGVMVWPVSWSFPTGVLGYGMPDFPYHGYLISLAEKLLRG